MLAALFPLYVNAAAKDRANKMATATKDIRRNRRPEHHVGEKWATIGMRQMAGMVTVGCDRRITKLRAKEVAMDISWHFLTNVQHTYDRKLVEKYDVSTTGTGGGGEYPLQDGFGGPMA